MTTFPRILLTLFPARRTVRMRRAPVYRVPWWESLALSHGTAAVLTAQAAERGAVLEHYVGALLTDIAARGARRRHDGTHHDRVVVPLTVRPPGLPPVA